MAASNVELRTVSQEDLITIRDIITADPIALEKWSLIVNYVVGSKPEELLITNLIKNGGYEEAVLRTLRYWYSNLGAEGTLQAFVEALRKRGLVTVADEVTKEFRAGATSSKSSTTWFEVGEVVPNFTGRAVEVESVHKMFTDGHSTESSIRNVVCICGLGGVGKTSLAKKYAHKYRLFYECNVIWIQAVSVHTMEKCFKKLAKRVGVELAPPPPEEEDGEEVTRTAEQEKEELMARVYKRFSDKKCLVIFDNVEAKEDLKQFLPKIVDPSKHTPYVLTTSRVRDLTTQSITNQLILGVLSTLETVCFIRSQLEEVTEVGGGKLAEKLQNFPLALQQAVAYIKDQLGFDDDAIEVYVKQFELCAEEFLDDERFKEDNEYLLTTLTTWTVTLNRIQKMNGGELALKLIHALAYLDPDRISKEFLAKVFQDQLGLILLRRFSMINLAQGLVTVHRLVQEVFKMKLVAGEKEIVLKLSNVIKNELEEGQFAITEFLQECVSHGLKLFPGRVINKEVLKDHDYRCTMEKVCGYLEVYERYAEFLSNTQAAVLMLESECGKEDYSTLLMKLWTAQAHYCMKAYEDTLLILAPILEAGIIENDAEKLKLFIGASATAGKAYSEMQDYGRALQIYDDIIALLERFGVKNAKVLEYTIEKAEIFRRSGKLDEALDLAEYVHQQHVELYGTNHVQTLVSREAVARVYYDKGEFAKASGAMSEVYNDCKLILGTKHPRTIKARETLEKYARKCD